MLDLYRYLIEKGLRDIESVPEPYKSILKAELFLDTPQQEDTR